MTNWYQSSSEPRESMGEISFILTDCVARLIQMMEGINPFQFPSSLSDYINRFENWRNSVVRAGSSLELRSFVDKFVEGMNSDYRGRSNTWSRNFLWDHGSVKWEEYITSFRERFHYYLREENITNDEASVIHTNETNMNDKKDQESGGCVVHDGVKMEGKVKEEVEDDGLSESGLSHDVIANLYNNNNQKVNLGNGSDSNVGLLNVTTDGIDSSKKGSNLVRSGVSLDLGLSSLTGLSNQNQNIDVEDGSRLNGHENVENEQSLFMYHRRKYKEDRAEAKTVNTQAEVDDPISAFFSGTIENFASLNAKKLYSEVFNVGGYKWWVLIFPKGNKGDQLSMYVEVADASVLPYGWNRAAKFSLAVINQVHNKITVRKEIHHQFNARESDWDFIPFMPLSELYDSGRGYIVNDSCIIESDSRFFHRQNMHYDESRMQSTHHNYNFPPAHFSPVEGLIIQQNFNRDRSQQKGSEGQVLCGRNIPGPSMQIKNCKLIVGNSMHQCESENEQLSANDFVSSSKPPSCSTKDSFPQEIFQVPPFFETNTTQVPKLDANGYTIDGAAFETAEPCIFGLVGISQVAAKEALTLSVIQGICSVVFLNAFSFLMSSFEGKDIFQIIDKDILKIQDAKDFNIEFKHKLLDEGDSPLLKLSKSRVVCSLGILFSCPKYSIAACFELFDGTTTEATHHLDGLQQLMNELDGVVSNYLTHRSGEDNSTAGSGGTSCRGNDVIRDQLVSESDLVHRRSSHVSRNVLLGMSLSRDLALKSWVFSTYRKLYGDDGESIQSKYINQHSGPREASQQGTSSEVTGKEFSSTVYDKSCQENVTDKFSVRHWNRSSLYHSTGSSNLDTGESGSMAFDFRGPGDSSDTRSSLPRELSTQQRQSHRERTLLDLRRTLGVVQSQIVLVHIGYSPCSGHYYFSIRYANNACFEFADSKVMRVREECVLTQETYILFYAKQGSPRLGKFIQTRMQWLIPWFNLSKVHDTEKDSDCMEHQFLSLQVLRTRLVSTGE